MKLILIIDDDKDLRESLKIGLEQNGFAVVGSETAGKAQEVLDRIIPDAIILDRMRPEIDGLSFLNTIRAGGDSTPVLMLTAMNGSDNVIDGLTSGADDYLEKPFQIKELILRLNNILKRTETKNIMPDDLQFVDGEFYIAKKLLTLSDSAKSALREMLSGKTVQIPAMTAKRLKEKLTLANIKNIDIIPVRGRGYKLTHIQD